MPHRSGPAHPQLEPSGAAYPPLDAEVAAALAASPLDYQGLFSDLTDARLIAVRSAFEGAPAPQLTGAVERTNHVLPGTEDVVVRVHRPRGAVGPLPALFWMHGGGFILDNHVGDDVRFDRWCGLGVIGVSIRYRVAPETPFPGPLEDCYAGLRWIQENAEELGVDPGRIGVGGTSAGGNLAAALCLLVRDRAELTDLRYQLLVYPALDDRQDGPTSRWPDPVWPPSAHAYAWGAYLGRAATDDDVSPYAAPARADDLGGLPPALIAVGSLDLLCDEAVDYARRLRHAGGAVDLYVYAGAPHGFDMVAPASSVAVRARRDIDEWLAQRLR